MTPEHPRTRGDGPWRLLPPNPAIVCHADRRMPLKPHVLRKPRHWFLLLALTCSGVLFAACGDNSAKLPTKAPGKHASAVAAVTNCLAVGSCYSTQQIRTAYGIQPLLNQGIDGRGKTVVLIELAAPALAPPRSTSISADMVGFDSLIDLPPAAIQVVNTLAPSASPGLANAEEVADTEIVHAIAPAASIRIILMSTTAEADPQSLIYTLSTAFLLGLSHSAVISISGSFGEHCFTSAEVDQLQSTLLTAQTDHVTVISSSGDFGAVSKPCPGSTAFSPIREVGLPDSDPLVLGVGGTNLTADRTSGAYVKERPGALFPRGTWVARSIPARLSTRATCTSDLTTALSMT